MTNILIPKETRAGESRVALIPSDVEVLTNKGHHVFVEHDAGKIANFSDQDYQNAGAKIRYLENHTENDFKQLFANIDIIVRVKRPDRAREMLESKVFPQYLIMIGALDPLEKNSAHIDEYHRALVNAYSIDQLNLEPNDPMNVLAAMSRIAGRFALLDAMNKFNQPIKKLVIIGFGTVGRSAFDEAIKQKIVTTVILNTANQMNDVTKEGADAILLKSDDLKMQQTIIKNAIVDADIVITSARRPNQLAPLLIPLETLQQMQKDSVIVDLALSEGGNVFGSEHDATKILGNQIRVTNTSGYPKALPHDASKLWSTASLLFILKLIAGNDTNLKEAKI